MLYTENSKEVVVFDIDPVGHVRAIYDDILYDVFTRLGSVRRPRASEINEDPATGLFVPDLSLSGGPILPGRPLKRQAESDEVAWLTRHILGV